MLQMFKIPSLMEFRLPAGMLKTNRKLNDVIDVLLRFKMFKYLPM